ncbi:MAG TPA: sigma-70 family RNA polymerase sigma factor [Gemmataceae bacterium]|nr:sigma-70 family RNA polymerase sigma factor [Gemmataceae bacterium]
MSPDATCWTLIRDAAGGDPAARERFARVYLPVVKAYITARWRDNGREVDDAAQDVFVECFKAGGLLEKAAADRPGGFRAFLLGAVRNVAHRHETPRRPVHPLPDGLPADDTGPDQAFDRAWARALLREAAAVQQTSAVRCGAAAVRRVQLLRLRFHDGLPIREIAKLWGEDAAKLHHDYATARDEFRAALREVIAFHHPGAPSGELDRLAAELFALVG